MEKSLRQNDGLLMEVMANTEGGQQVNRIGKVYDGSPSACIEGISMKEIVTELRQMLHWPVAYLADKSGVSVWTIHNIEKHGGGNLDTYEKLLDAMGYELEVVKKEM